MSDSEIVSMFCKSQQNGWHHLSRRFHNLDNDGRRAAVDLIHAGVEPKKAIDRARRQANDAASPQAVLQF